MLRHNTMMLMAATSSMALLAADDAAASGAVSAPGRQTIKIQGFDFEVPAPYTEGHVLTANEASSLNQTYGENIRNNSASRIKAAQEAAQKTDPPGEFDIDAIGGIKGTAATADNSKTLRQVIDEYAATYVFGVRSARVSEPVDPVEREAHRIATDTINESLKAKNVKRKDLAEGQFEAAVKAYAGSAEVVKEAKRRVTARAAIGKDTLDLSALGLNAEPAAQVEGNAQEQAAA